jgi:hypothetical protein
LANKLEIAQSSYNVVQKTLSQISSFIKEPALVVPAESNPVTEDDWDNSGKSEIRSKQ